MPFIDLKSNGSYYCEFMKTLKTQVYRSKPADFSPSAEVAACYIEVDGKFLLLKRRLGSSQEGTWGVPGGKLEVGESPKAAVIREVFEETEILLSQVSEVGPLYIHGAEVDFVFHMFYAKLIEFPSIRLDLAEHSDSKWVRFTDWSRLPLMAGGMEAMHHFQALYQQPQLARKAFYFLRHGQTDANLAQNWGVDSDLPLNEHGRQQAMLAKDVVKGLPFDQVFYSPLHRAIETKAIVTQDNDVQEVEVENFRECSAEIWNTMVKLEEGSGYRICEATIAFHRRVMLGLQAALNQSDTPLIVAHGGVHWVLGYLFNIENHSWKVGNCQLVYFQPTGDTQWKAQIIESCD